jgi:hypothetical protein
MKTDKRRWIASTPTDAQRERNWVAIRERLPKGPVSGGARARRAGVVAALALAAAVAVAPFAWRHRGAGIQGATLETGAQEQETITLGDGSRVVVDESSRVRLAAIAPSQVRLELERGGLEADVTHVDGRSFVVAVGGLEVVVVGTHFDVQTDGEGAARTVRVSVARGRVEVRRGKEPSRFLGAGESWSGPLVAPVVEPSAPVTVPHAVDAGARPPVAAAPRFRLSREFRDDFALGKYADAWAELGPDGLADAARLAQPADLFEVAQVARWTGHTREAAEAFDAIVTRAPNDGRAGVAALELGRLRMNDLGDASGAVEAFEHAMELAPNVTFREDAAARRIQALESSGDLAACAAARDEYLTTYPGGTHAVTVARRCQRP